MKKLLHILLALFVIFGLTATVAAVLRPSVDLAITNANAVDPMDNLMLIREQASDQGGSYGWLIALLFILGVGGYGATKLLKRLTPAMNAWGRIGRNHHARPPRYQPLYPVQDSQQQPLNQLEDARRAGPTGIVIDVDPIEGGT